MLVEPDDKSGDVAELDREAEADEKAEAERECPVRCAVCRAILTHRRARTTVNGSHAHTFKNPAAIDFLIGCYDAAPGCRNVGERSTVWTWFPGFSWQIALCKACGSHVGWRFEREGRRFVALILDRIVEGPT